MAEKRRKQTIGVPCSVLIIDLTNIWLQKVVFGNEVKNGKAITKGNLIRKINNELQILLRRLTDHDDH